MQGQRDAWHERLDVCLGDANHPAMDFVERRIAGKQRGGMAVGADTHQHEIEQGAGRVKFVGAVKDVNNNVISIDQLWGIGFGDGTGHNGGVNQLFFTAGPSDTDGYFGVINFIK